MPNEKGSVSMDIAIALALKTHIIEELESSHMYLQMAVWFEKKDLPGFAKWLRTQAREGVANAMVLVNFLEAREVTVTLAPLRAKTFQFNAVHDIMGGLLQRGRHIASGQHDLLAMSENAEDRDTSVLLAWFAAAQLEEQFMVTQIVEQVHACRGDSGAAMRSLDGEMARREGIIPNLLKTQQRHGMA